MQLSEENKSLAVRIKEGDPEAENLLFSLFKEKIKLMVNVRLRGKISDEDKDDIISEVMHALLQSLRKGGFDPGRGISLEAYTAGIAGNIVGQYFRKQKKNKEYFNIDSQKNLENPGNILSDIIDEERNKRLKSYLGKLKEKYREILILRIYEEKSIEEIANHLNIEKRRVSERINYAVKLLLKESKKDNYFQ